MKNELGIAVIGCGRIGITHLEAMKDLKEREGGLRLVATADPEGGRAEQYARNYNAEYHYRDYREALSNPAVDAVVLALPNGLHAPITVEAANAGKHILVEKPMAANGEDADTMVAAADNAQVKLMVAHSRRYIKAHFNAWERIDEIGRPISATYLSLMRDSNPPPWWKRKEMTGHLVFTSLGSHTIDFMLWLFKGRKKAVRVYSEGFSNIPGLEGFDEASVVVGFDDGALATTTLSMNNRTPRIERVVVIGTGGAMHLEHSFCRTSGPSMVGAVMSRLILNDDVIWEGIQEEWYFTLQMKEFVACIRDDRPPLADGSDVRHVLPIVEAADLSAERHEVIQLESTPKKLE